MCSLFAAHSIDWTSGGQAELALFGFLSMGSRPMPLIVPSGLHTNPHFLPAVQPFSHRWHPSTEAEETAAYQRM